MGRAITSSRRGRYRAAGLLLAALVAPVAADDGQDYGLPLSDSEPVRIGELSAHPERYVNRRVKVVGLVKDVCPMKGCWVDILAEAGTETVRFKVQDDVIVFPATAQGGEIVAEGILRRHEMNRARAVQWLAHLAEERGEPFDPATVTGPLTFYQIEGAGARVTPPPG